MLWFRLGRDGLVFLVRRVHQPPKGLLKAAVGFALFVGECLPSESGDFSAMKHSITDIRQFDANRRLFPALYDFMIIAEGLSAALARAHGVQGADVRRRPPALVLPCATAPYAVFVPLHGGIAALAALLSNSSWASLMAKPKKAPPRDEDPEESKRFLDLAAELEAAGDLNPTEGEEAVERLMGKAAPASADLAPPKQLPEEAS